MSQREERLNEVWTTKDMTTCYDNMREEAGKRFYDAVATKMQETGMNYVQLFKPLLPAARTSAITVACKGRSTNIKPENNRPFSLGMLSIGSACQDSLRLSCHEIMYGETPVCKVPPKDVYVCDVYSRLSDESKEWTDAEIKRLLKNNRIKADRSIHAAKSTKNGMEEYETNYNKQTLQRIIRRFLQLCEVVGRPPHLLCGAKGTNPSFRISLKSFGNGEILLALSRFMYIADYHNTSLDYFLSTDYTLNSRLVEAKTEREWIGDEYKLKSRFLSRYLYLTNDQQQSILNLLLMADTGMNIVGSEMQAQVEDEQIEIKFDLAKTEENGYNKGLAESARRLYAKLDDVDMVAKLLELDKETVLAAIKQTK